MPRRHDNDNDQALPLDGMPAPEPPAPTAGDLVSAWCTGWASEHGGQYPDASVVKRVAGCCRTIAKDRTDLASWQAAWRAARTAGTRGRYDIVAQLAAPVVTTGRANHFLTLASTTTDPQLGGPTSTGILRSLG